MKICPICQTKYEGGATCKNCGIPLIDLTQPTEAGGGSGRKKTRKPDKTQKTETVAAAPETEESMPEEIVREPKQESVSVPENVSVREETPVPEEVPLWDENPIQNEIPVQEAETSAPEEAPVREEVPMQAEVPKKSPEVSQRGTSVQEEWAYGLPVPDAAKNTERSSDRGEAHSSGADSSSKKQKVPKEKKEKKENRERDAVPFDPRLIVIVVAVVLVVIALIFALKSRNAKKTAVSDTYTVTENPEVEEADTVEEADAVEEAEESETVDLSDVDIDVVSDTYAEFTGTLTTRGDEYMVKLSNAYNIYAYNDSGETVVMNNVNQIILSEIGGWDIAKYTEMEVTAGGYLEVSGQDMTMALVDFEGPELEDTAVHTYQIMISDCTWTEAMQLAQERGGYLVRINSKEEYDAIISQLSAGDYSKYHFYLGGRRDSSGTEYYWVDTDNQFIGDCLNSSDSWCQSAWYNGEPSYADGDVAEDAMNLFCVGGTWYLNDSSMDLVGNYPDMLTGKVGYIIEFD